MMFARIPPITLSAETGKANGTRKLFWIVMYRNMPECNASVLAQELREFWLVTWLFTVPGLALVTLATLWGVEAMIGAFVAMCVLWLLPATPPVARWIEYRGHEAEVQAAVALYGADETAYRAKEADTMHRKYGGMFKHLTVDQIIARMREQTNASRSFVRGKMPVLQRFKQEVR